MDIRNLATDFYSRVFNKGDLDALDDFVHPEAVDYNPLPGQAKGREGIRQTIGMYLTAFDSRHADIEEMLVQDDLVVSRLRYSGTHTGDFMGIEPTEKRVETYGLEMVRFRDGKIVERWGLVDVPSILNQLGVELKQLVRS